MPGTPGNSRLRGGGFSSGAAGRVRNTGRVAPKLAFSLLCENPRRRTGLTTFFHGFIAEALWQFPDVRWLLFAGPEPSWDSNDPRVEGVREAYTERLAAQQDGLAAICRAAGWGFSLHRTDHPPEAALLGLYTALAPEAGRR